MANYGQRYYRNYQNRQQPEMDSGLVDLVGLAQAGNLMGLNEPPPLDDLLKLLSVAGEMQSRETEFGLQREKLDLEKQKMQQMSPDMLNALLPFIHGNPQATQTAVNRAAPGILSPETQPAPETVANAGASRPPKARQAVKSQTAFPGYTPPQGDVEAVLDDQGNILNFVQQGTQAPVQDFVPSAESVGGWGASKYAVAEQMKALGRALGLIPQSQNTLPY
jgi:hypothetical protein